LSDYTAAISWHLRMHLLRASVSTAALGEAGMSIKVLLADDHAWVRSTVRDLLSASDDITVVAECADGSEVAGAAAHSRPDVVLTDLHMPRMGGLEAMRTLLGEQPDVRVIVLSGVLCQGSAREAKALGAAGYLLKADAPGDLPEQVRTVAAGGTAWSPRTAAVLQH
jgi:DNA-binding NarL/FixJ family response regulator